MTTGALIARLKAVSPAAAALVGALVVLTPIYVQAVYLPLAREIAASRAEVARRQGRIEQFARLSGSFRRAGAAEEADWAASRQTWQREVPTRPDTVALVQRLSLAARQAGIVDAGFKELPEPRPAPQTPSLSGAAVEMSFHATYRELAVLVAGLSGVERLLSVESLEVQRGEPRLAAKIVIVGYFGAGEPCSPTATS
jgi:hypothetical protein